MRLAKSEPAVVTGFVSALIAMAIAYGAPITDAQTQQTVAFVGAALLLFSVVIRQMVSSPATVARIGAQANADIQNAYQMGADDAERGVIVPATE